MSAKPRGRRSPPPDGRTIRRLFLALYRHMGKAHPEAFGSSIAVELDARIYHMSISPVAGHWGPSISAHLRIEDLPVSVSAGSGYVDFIALVMPLKPKPLIYQVNVNKVSRGRNIFRIEDFVKQFCEKFKEEWNTS